MLTNEELLKAFYAGRDTADFAILHMGLDPEEVRSQRSQWSEGWPPQEAAGRSRTPDRNIVLIL